MNIRLILCIALSLCVLITDPFHLVQTMQWVYCLPMIAAAFFVANKDLYVSQKGFEAKEVKQIDDAKKEVFKSILRHVLTVTGALLAVGLKIPFLSDILDLLNLIFGSVDGVVAALNVLIGVGLSLIGIFKDPARFKTRSMVLIEPRKIHD